MTASQRRKTQSKITSLRIPDHCPSIEDDPVGSYAWLVLKGKTPACRYVRLACERHFRDLRLGPKRGLYYRPEKAAYAVGFFVWLRQSKGEWAGRPLTLSHWQQFIVGSVFGWFRADGTRRFRTVYEEVPRKNGKTTMISGIGIYGLVGDKEAGAEVYCCATKKDQARLIFDEAKRMVRASNSLSRLIGVFKSNLSVDRTSSKFEPLSADERTLDGLNPSMVLLDELHKHRNRGVLDVMDTALGSRRQPLLWIITTAGDDSPESVYAQENDYALKVLEHDIEDDNAFVFISTIDKEDRWDDPKAWAKANPNIGVSVKFDDLKRQADKAKNSPAAQAEFKRLRLNVRTAAANRFINADVWARNSLCPRGVQPAAYRAEIMERFKGRRFFGALDMSSKTDLSAWVMMFERAEGERWTVLARFWMPADTVSEKSDRDRIQYQRWIDEGWIEPTMGNVIDHEEIRAGVAEDCRTFQPISIAFDPWNSTQLAVGLQGDGLPMFEFVQGLRSYTAPTKELDARLQAASIDHGDNPVMRWMSANLAVQTDKNLNVMPTKKLSNARIDGMTGLIMSIGRSMAEDDTLYGDGRGLLILR